MKIFLLTNSYYPDPMGIAPLADDLAAQLHRLGHDVSVVTTFPYYPDWQVPAEYRGRWLAVEDREGVTVYRSYVFVRPRATVAAKALFYASFTASSLFNIIRSGKPDVVLVMSPPPTLVMSAWIWKALHGARIVLDVQDIVPDAAISFGMMTNPVEIRFFQFVERLAYRLADSIVVVAESFVPNLVGKGVPDQKLSIIHNWVDTALMRPLAPTGRIRRPLGLSDSDFLAMYAGNMGASQGLEVVLQAAMLLANCQSIHFALIGGGTMATALRARASELELQRVHFLPAFPFSEMPEVYADADVGLVVQKANVLDVNLPSKIPVIMACGRPIIGVVNATSDAHRILEHSRAAILVPTGDASALAGAVKSLADDRIRARQMGDRGRVYAVDRFSQRSAIESYARILRTAQDASDRESGAEPLN